MPWSGGSYTKGNNATGGWTGDASLGIGIEAGRHDTQDNDFATGINQCLNKDGSNAATGNLNLGGFKLANVATGTASTDAINLLQAQSGINTQSTTLEVTNTRFSNDTVGPWISLQKSRGAAVGTNTIVTSGDSVGAVFFRGANGTGYNAAAVINCEVDGTPGATNDMPGRLVFATTADGAGSATERMRITNAGLIGVGLTNPGAPLEAQALASNAVALGMRGRSSDNTSVLLITNNAAAEIGRIQTDATAMQINKSGANPILFNTNGTERLRITGAGRVGVNVGSPNATVQIINSESAGLNTVNIQSNVAGDVATHALVINKTDNNSTTSQRFIGFQINATTTGSGQINANGASQAAFGTFSDARLKENITNLPSQLSNIMSLRPVEFDYKDGSGHQIGFIAQEVEEIYPDLIGDGGNGFLTLTGLGKNEARMIKAFQEFADLIQQKITALETRVAALEA